MWVKERSLHNSVYKFSHKQKNNPVKMVHGKKFKVQKVRVPLDKIF